MPSTMKKQKGGSACGAKKMTGGSHTKKMTGGSPAKKMTGGSHAKKMTGGSHAKKMTGGAGCGAKPKVGGASKSKAKYGPNEAWCMNCGRSDKSKGRVTMVNPKDISKKTSKRTMKMRVGECPRCHGKVYKIVGN